MHWTLRLTLSILTLAFAAGIALAAISANPYVGAPVGALVGGFAVLVLAGISDIDFGGES